MTFSLIARDETTGMFGIGIATSSIAVGNRCPWARAKVGAVTSQHRSDIRLGPRGWTCSSKAWVRKRPSGV